MVFSSLLTQCHGFGWLMGIFKSESPPSIPDKLDGPVKVAVTHNFKDVVIDSGREAFVLFYAPWCSHCKRVEPVWEELGAKLKDEEVDIVKIDATTNEWPRYLYNVAGYPTIYWKFADKSKKPIRYRGDRDLNEFIKYVSEKASNELSGWDREGKPKKKEL